ncbi:MAG TPA: hypothetical protein VNK46_13015 [Nitrospiraceae bacterium]|jgi:hypothetical protein|nr:hypothetical protein [Nitrospiraceae bacterium]
MNSEFSEPAPDQESGRRHDARVGVIVLSPSLRVLYASRAAIEWLTPTTLRTDLREPASSSGGLPQGVTNIARTIVEELGRRVASRNWEPFEVRRHLDEWQEPVWLRGLGLPNPQGLQRSRIVLTLSRNPFSP